MVTKRINIFLLLISLFTFMGCKSQRLKNIKYFNEDVLKNIPYNKIYSCVEMYETNSSLKEKRKIQFNYNITLEIKNDGYVETTNFASVDKNGNNGVIYVKKGEIKIDLITLVSDMSPTITTYNAKFSDRNLYLIEDRWIIGGDNLSYLIFKLEK
jgi:hypothetical protein